MMKLEEKAVELLKEKRMIFTCAESCTGGLIAKRITDVSGASEVFECGVVSYSNEIKHRLLGVKEETLQKYGAVSEECAKEMVSGVLKLTGADIAVAVTGIAGPDSDMSEKPVGLVYIALSDGKTTAVKKCLNAFSENVRENNRNKSADTAFEMIVEYLK